MVLIFFHKESHLDIYMGLGVCAKLNINQKSENSMSKLRFIKFLEEKSDGFLKHFSMYKFYRYFDEVQSF